MTIDDEIEKKGKHGRHVKLPEVVAEPEKAGSSKSESKSADASEKKASGGRHAKPLESAVIPRIELEPAQPQPTQPQADPEAPLFASDFPAPTMDLSGEKKNFFEGKTDLIKKVAAIVGGVVLALILIAYGIGVFYFSDRFFPNTKLNDADISMKATSDLERMLDNATRDYSLRVTGNEFNMSITAAQAGFEFDPEQMAAEILSDVNPWAWPIEVFMTHDVSDLLHAGYNDAYVDDVVKTAVAAHNENAKPTENATIAYDPDKKKIAVKAEIYGTQLVDSEVATSVKNAISKVSRNLELGRGEVVQPTIYATDERLAAAADKANEMLKADITLKLGESEAAHITSEVSVSWIKLGDDFSVELDPAAMEAWVEQLASDFDTVGADRTYTRPDGKECSVSGGDYGWEVDHAALIELVKKAMADGAKVTENVPASSEGVAYNGAGKADWGKRYLDVDLSEQHVYFYGDDSSVIWESDCVSGAPGKNSTPQGVYDLNGKEAPSKLIGYENGKKIYETMVRYWMPFIGNGIGFHDADWQPGFGGSLYAQGLGSHGCINLPVGAAAELYGIIEWGDVVVVHW